MKKMKRHGDINLYKVNKLEGELVKSHGKYILARGEATNSVHEISVLNPDNLVVYEHEGTLFIKVIDENASLTHTHDHEPLVIEPGIYKVVREREINHFEDSIERKVTD